MKTMTFLNQPPNAVHAILLVEDNPAHAELVRRGLEHSEIPATILHAEDGEDALAYLMQQGPYADTKAWPRPCVVLLDINLPKLSGLEVLKAVKSNDQTRNIPVVMLTTSEAENDIIGAYEHSANSFLVKPVDFAKFVKLMDNLAPYWLSWNHSPRPS